MGEGHADQVIAVYQAGIDEGDATVSPAAVTASTRSRALSSGSARLTRRTVVPGRTSTPCAVSSARMRTPRSGSTVGRTSGSCSIWVQGRADPGVTAADHDQVHD